jgi:ureidoacrylate peracid hydrolase
MDNPFRTTAGLPPFDSEQIALVVVDMQYFDAHADWGEGRTARQLGVLDAFDEYFDQLRDVTPRIQRLLDAARGKGVEVIHIRVAEVTADSRDVGWKQLVRGLAVPKNSKEAQLLDEVAPVGDEIVVSKSSSGVFATTNLDRLLRNLGITTLVLVGTSTSGCVESAACDATDLGYSVIIVRDACACSTRASHELALDRMAGASASVASTGELIERLQALPPVDRAARSGEVRAAQYVPKSVPSIREADNPYSLIFGPALPQPLAPGTTALLLLDLQRFGGDPAGGLARLVQGASARAHAERYYERVRAALPRITSILAAGRAAGCMIVFARSAAQTLDGRDLSPRIRSLGAFPVLGTTDTDWLPELSPRPGEVVVTKPAAGVCTGTGIDELLRNAGISTVVLAGLSYDGGLEGSLRSLTDRGYGAVVPPDACVTYDERLQTALWNAETGIINVVPAAEIAARLTARLPSASPAR